MKEFIILLAACSPALHGCYIEQRTANTLAGIEQRLDALTSSLPRSGDIASPDPHSELTVSQSVVQQRDTICRRDTADGINHTIWLARVR